MTSAFERRADRMIGLMLRSLIRIFFFVVIFGGCSAAFVHLLVRLQTTQVKDLLQYIPQALIPVAILVALSGLMYNRARAVGAEARKHRFRSLYAAERLFAASCFYLAGLASFIFVALCEDFLVTYFRVSPQELPATRVSLVMCGLPLFGWAVFETYHALRLLAPNGAYRRTVRVARRVKELM